MPTQPQPMRRSQQSSKGKPPAGSKSPADPAPARAGGAASTNTSDEVYGVVSVLYHSLQGVDTYERYLEDARTAEDDELVSFFEQCIEEEQRRAERAKSLLAARLEETEGDDEDEDDDDAVDEDDDDDE